MSNYIELAYLALIELAYLTLKAYPIIFISVIIHEIGHYAGSRLLGYKPKYFIIGTGAPILKKYNSWITFEINKIKVSINPFGFGGLVDIDSYIKNASSFKIKIMCFGGPIMNFIFFYISFIFAMYFYGYDDKFNNIYLNIFMSCNLAFFFLNLLPHQGSDGWYILNINDKVKDTSSSSDSIENKVIGLVSSKYYENNIKPLI